MLTLISEAIESYVASHSTRPSKVLTRLAAKTLKDTDFPQMMTGPLQGAFLRLLVSVLRARRVLEIGTFTGYSALAMAEALPANGRIITCDIDPKATAIARQFWRKSPHGSKIRLELGPALKTLERLKGQFDLVFIDADKENYAEYWKACVPIVRKGGLLVVDNVLWSGKVLRPRDARARAISRFNQIALRDRRVDVVMLTVRDGVTLGLKR